jgi:hypothetical protein
MQLRSKIPKAGSEGRLRDLRGFPVRSPDVKFKRCRHDALFQRVHPGALLGSSQSGDLVHENFDGGDQSQRQRTKGLLRRDSDSTSGHFSALRYQAEPSPTLNCIK